MSNPKPLRVEFIVRNNLLLTKMEEHEIKSARDLATLIGKPSAYGNILLLIGMKLPARLKDGSWRSIVHEICAALQCLPEDIFSTEQEFLSLKKNRAHAEMTFAEVQQLTNAKSGQSTPELLLQADETRKALAKALSKLTSREERVLRLRFGLHNGREATAEEIAKELGISGMRVLQIESGALKKLSHPSLMGLFRQTVAQKFVTKDGCTLYHLDEDILAEL
ncbi:MAG: sigma-70 family RNA polymerase sigma factor [Patescibacteria group bacterium]